MREEEIRVGDRLRIRDWDDMADEFGIRNGEIQCDATFTQGMKRLCGMPFTVKNIQDTYRPFKKYRSEEDGFAGWIITAHMLEPIGKEDEEIIPGPSEDLFGFLFQ